MSYLNALVSEVYLKDIAERRNIKREDVLSALLDLLCSSIGSLTNPTRVADAINIKQKRSGENLVALNTVKAYTYVISEVSINGKTAYSVGEDCLLLVCLAPDVQPGDVEQMAEYAPAKAIISRDSFADDTATSNAWYILRDRGVELKLV